MSRRAFVFFDSARRHELKSALRCAWTSRSGRRIFPQPGGIPAGSHDPTGGVRNTGTAPGVLFRDVAQRRMPDGFRGIIDDRYGAWRAVRLRVRQMSEHFLTRREFLRNTGLGAMSLAAGCDTPLWRSDMGIERIDCSREKR